MKKHLNKQIEIIGEAYNNLDDIMAEKLVSECVNVIKNGHSIIATALGKNVPICDKFVGTLSSLGISANFLHTNSAIHGDLGVVKPGDLVIVLSKSGETEETVYLSKILTSLGTNNWLLTCKPDSSAAKLIDKNIVFNLKHEGDPWNLIPNNSSLVFLVFLQALSMELLERLDVPIEIFKRNHPGGHIGKMLSSI